MKKKKRYKSLNISFISLCPAGANKLPVVMKSEEDETGNSPVTIATVTKAAPDFDKNGELLALVYVPDHADADECVADAEVIKQACQSFASNGMNLDIKHNNLPIPKSNALITESFIVQKDDKRFDGMADKDGKAVDATGAWAVVIKILDAGLKKLYKEGGWHGVSMFGYGATEEIAKEEVTEEANALWKVFKALFDKKPQERKVETMTDKEMEDVVQKCTAATAKAFEPILKALAPKEPEKLDLTDAKAVAAHLKTLEGVKKEELDLTDAKSVAAHIKALKVAKMLENVDVNDPASLEEHLEALKKAAEKPGSNQKATSATEADTVVASEKVYKSIQEDVTKAIGA